jgi:hypothetical protein
MSSATQNRASIGTCSKQFLTRRSAPLPGGLFLHRIPSTLFINLEHDAPRPLNGGHDHAATSRAVSGVAEVFCGLEVTSNQDSRHDCEHTVSSLIHSAKTYYLIRFLFAINRRARNGHPSRNWREWRNLALVSMTVRELLGKIRVNWDWNFW